ncbi:hypothetical protein ABFS83_13G095800 [Erythranthe nasuta]
MDDNSLSKGKKSEAIRKSNSIDKLGTSFSGKVKIIDVPEYSVDFSDEEEEEEEEDDFSDEDLLAQMGYGKSEPETNVIKDPQISSEEEEEDEEEEEGGLSEESFLAQMGYLKNEPVIHEPITTPTASLNLVSAFKGSREKEGRAVKESRVSWSPDVYDPPPTSDDHFTTSKTERHKNEHKVKGVAGKNRQKTGGKREGGASADVGEGSSKGGKGGGSKGKFKEKKPVEKKAVDKKQAKKHGRGASKHSGFNED